MFFPPKQIPATFPRNAPRKKHQKWLLDFCCRCWALVTTQNASKELKTPQHEYDEGPKIFSCCQKRSKFLLCWNKDVALRRQFRPSWQLVFAFLTAHLIKAKQSKARNKVARSKRTFFGWSGIRTVQLFSTILRRQYVHANCRTPFLCGVNKLEKKKGCQLAFPARYFTVIKSPSSYTSSFPLRMA